MRAFVVEVPRTGALRALNYAPAVERIRRAGSNSARPLRDIVKAFGPAYGSVFTRIDCHPDHGVELITQSDMFAAEPSGRVIRRDSMPQPERHLVTKGQVLIAGAGTLGENELYGRSILADARLAGKYVGPDSMSLHFEDPDDDFSLFAYAWLASPTGVQAIRSTSYGTKILRLRKDLLSTLPVPDAPAPTVMRVAELIRECVKARNDYAETQSSVRRKVERLFTSEEIAISASRRSRVLIEWSGPLPTLRAWNFASASPVLANGIKRWSTRLRDWLEPNGLFMGARVARISCVEPNGVDLLSQRDVCSIRPAPRRIRDTNPSLKVESNWLLVASRGQMTEGALFGTVERAFHMPTDAAISGDVLRLVPWDGLGAALYGFLTTNTGRRLLQSTAYGTSIPAMREDLLLDLPVPPPDDPWVKEVTMIVDGLTKSRNQAAAAESEAIRIIEEEVLPQWLG